MEVRLSGIGDHSADEFFAFQGLARMVETGRVVYLLVPISIPCTECPDGYEGVFIDAISISFNLIPILLAKTLGLGLL